MPQLADFGVVRTSGAPAALIRFGTRSPFNHAVISLGGDWIVEAQPGGAIVSRASKYPLAAWSSLDLTAAERGAIGGAAHDLVGTPYGWPDIAALTFACAGIRSHWIDERIENEHRLICSQLVDRAYLLGGVHLFADGRLSGEVTPGDLGQLIASGVRS